MKLIMQLILVILCSTTTFLSLALPAQDVSSGEEIVNYRLKPIVVYAKGIDQRRYWKLVKSVKKVYPLAKVAQEKLRNMEDSLATMSSKKVQRQYVQSIYKQIREEYTPVLKKMTMSDGRVLIRLIDRETDYTAYEVIDEFKGGLTAVFWQGIGKLFGQNLKDEYGKSSEDKMIEMIIKYYEAGLI